MAKIPRKIKKLEFLSNMHMHLHFCPKYLQSFIQFCAVRNLRGVALTTVQYYIQMRKNILRSKFKGENSRKNNRIGISW